MANKTNEEELEELNKKLKESTTPQMNENSYLTMLKNLGEKEGYDYISDYNVLKNSLLQQSYSPRTNKVYTYEEAQALTPQQYFDDVMAAADHTESGNKVTNALKTFVYGANEKIGGTALYKAVKGEEALKEKANQVERVYGDNSTARKIGNIVGNLGLYTVGSMLGGLSGAAAAGAISEGGQAYTYSNDPATIVSSAERGALFGLVRGGVANTMKSAIANAVPSAMGSVGKNFLINAASQGAGAYAGNAVAGTASNIINTASGKEVTMEDWTKPFWSVDALANAGISALIGGAINTAIDRAQINQLMTKDINTMNEQANARAIGVEKALRNGDIESANAFAKAEIDDIEKFTNNTYASMKFNDTFKEGMMNDWMNSMSKLYGKYGYKIDYTPTLGTGTSSYGVTPNYATQNTPSTVTATPTVTTPNTANVNVPNISVSTTTAQASANIPLNNGGITNDTNGGEPSVLNQLLEIENEYSTSNKATELEQKAISNLNDTQKALKTDYNNNKGVDVVFFTDDGGDIIGTATRDGRIFISSQIENPEDIAYVADHELAELMLLNNSDRILKQMSDYVQELKNNETGLNYYLQERLKGFPDDIVKEFQTPKGKVTLAKEAVCDIKGVGNLPSNSPERKLLEDAFGKETVSKIEKGLNELEKKADFRRVTSDIQSTEKIPAFAKKNNQTKNLTIEKQNSDIKQLENANNNLRNELAKGEDKVKATEMWSKRTERGKLNKKLDTAKNKLEQTRFEGKEKLKETKEEGKEKLKKLTSKKNEEKAKAVKEVKAKASDAISKLKAKGKENVKEAKKDARATTSEKKLNRSLERLDKALNSAYDKPNSPEVEKALDTVRKQSRGTIKLIDKVKGKLPSKYDFFIDDVLDIVDSYYTGGNAMTDEKRASLEKKSRAISEFAKEHPEYPLSKNALALLKEPSKKNIADLNSKDLISLAEDLQEIGTAVRDMFSFARASEDAMKLRNEALDFAKDRLERGEGRNYNNLSSNAAMNKMTELGENYVDKRSTIETLTTALSGGDPDSPFNFMPNQLKDGYDRYNRAMEKMLKLFDKFVVVKKVGNVRYYNNKLNEILDPDLRVPTKLKTVNGEVFSPTISDAISTVWGAKDPQFASHSIGVVTDKFKDGKPLLSEGGNVVFSNNIDEKFGNINKGLKRGIKVKLSAEDIKALEKDLEKYPIIKDLMDTFKELTDLTYDLNNEPHEAIYGERLEKRDYYFPVSTDPATRRRQNLSDKLKGFNGLDASATLQNTSIVKPVVEGANGQILIYPIDRVISKLIDDTALYNGYATALYDINSFLSAETEDGETLVELINHLDPSYLTNYGKITNALVGNTKRGVTSPLGGRYTESILKGNFWLALKQAGSYFTAAPFFDNPTRSLMAGLFKRGEMAQIIKDYYKDEGIDISGLNNSETLKYFWDDKVNAELSTRTRGYSTLDKKRIFKHTGLLERINALDWYKTMDIGTINSLAWAMFKDMLDNSGTDIGTDVFMNNLGSRYINAMIATQPNPAVVTKAPIQVDGNLLDRALSYMADPRIKNVNALANARMHYKYSKGAGDEEKIKKYGSAYKRIIVGTLASLAYITTVSRLKQDAEGKKKETAFWQDMIGNVFGLSIGMEQIVGKFLNNYSFDVSLPDTQALNLILNLGEDMFNVFGGKNTEKNIDKVLQDISGFTGIPYKNLKNDYTALTNLFDKSTFYKNKIKADSNMNKKYEKFKDEIYDYEEFYKLYQVTREKAVKETYGAYNNQNVKHAIEDNGGDLETYFKMFKK